MGLLIRFFVLGFIFSMPAPAGAAPYAGSDIDGDGVSDITLISIEGDSSLTWRSYSASGQEIDQKDGFGRNGANITLANWFSPTQASLGYVSVPNGGVEAVWTALDPNGATVQKTLGASTSFKFISGGDINNNGYSDAAVLRTEISGALIWDIRPDFFAAGDALRDARNKESALARRHRAKFSSGRVSLRFGASTDLPFMFSPGGQGSVLAILREINPGSYAVITRNPYTGRTRTILLGTLSSPLTPLPLKRASGGDILAIPSKGQSTTSISFFSSRGLPIGNSSLTGTGTIIVGQFPGMSGQGLAIQTNSSFTFVHPSAPDSQSSGQVALGIAVDDINITSFLPDSNSGGGPLPTCDMPSQAPPSSLSSVCSVMHPMNRCVLYKPGSGGTSDDRTGKPVFLWYEEINNPNVGQLKVLASNGAQLATFGFYYPAPAPLARFYSGYVGGSRYSGQELMDRALAASGSQWLYFLTKSGECWGPVRDANGRSGGR